MTVITELMNKAQRLPNLSAVQMQDKVPNRPPVWKRPLIAPMSALALGRVSRAKYAKKVGWPSVVAMMDAQ